jgi:4-hydroxybenzoate polyprenyltransferase
VSLSSSHATARGLLLASHLAPTVTVTVLVALLASAVGAPAQSVVGLTVAVLLGQLSIGWSNDAADAADDRRAGRVTKPVVAGLVSTRTLWQAAVVALGASIVASVVLLGWATGGLHVLAVLGAWAYNLRLKDTPLSPVPYGLAFGLLPVILGRLGEPEVAVPPWVVLSTACLGVAAHLANTAPDVRSDRLVGRGGLAVLVGSPAARGLAVALAAGAGLTVVVAGPGGGAVLVASLVLVLPLVAAAVVAHGRWLFPALMAVAVIAATGLLVLT